MSYESILQEARRLFDGGRYQAAIDALLPISEAGNVEAQALPGAIYFMGPGKTRVYHRILAGEWVGDRA